MAIQTQLGLTGTPTGVGPTIVAKPVNGQAALTGSATLTASADVTTSNVYAKHVRSELYPWGVSGPYRNTTQEATAAAMAAMMVAGGKS